MNVTSRYNNGNYATVVPIIYRRRNDRLTDALLIRGGAISLNSSVRLDRCARFPQTICLNRNGTSPVIPVTTRQSQS